MLPRRTQFCLALTLFFATGCAASSAIGANHPSASVGVTAPPVADSSVDVSCVGGVATVSTPRVLAQQDGVHLSIGRLGAYILRAELDGSTFEIMRAGSRAERFQLPPGDYTLQCAEGTDTATATASLTVLDPEGWFQSPTLGCECTCHWLFGASHWVRDPIPLIGAQLELHPGDRLEPRGYESLSMKPGPDETGWFVVVRDGEGIAKIRMTAGSGGGDLEACADVFPETGGPNW